MSWHDKVGPAVGARRVLDATRRAAVAPVSHRLESTRVGDGGVRAGALRTGNGRLATGCAFDSGAPSVVLRRRRVWSTLFLGLCLSFCSPATAQERSAQTTPAPEDAAAPPPVQDTGAHEHTLDIPGGPALKFNGFVDFNYLIGSPANGLQFPLGVPAHDTFQIGELDLFMSSQLSERLSFLAEVIFGSDASTNELGVDLERLQLTYKASPFFQMSGGRYHTAIGYYNTAYHHGLWFQTATGRPFMDYFEDSGGILPIHNVGLTTTGLVPGTGSTGLHWIAEVGNGRAGSRDKAPVQIAQSDRGFKSTNVAIYIRPDWLSGLQVGVSSFHDRLYPDGVGRVNQRIWGGYAVYITPTWEFLNEVAFLWNEIDAVAQTFTSKLTYTQLSRKFGLVRPYGRFQYVTSPAGDPVNIFIGKYEGPSVGVRYDLSRYAALKAQYNRLYQENVSPTNGASFQVAFTF